MQRLLQGDVGSGKTIVAAIGCLAAVDAGAQAAVMAPTEILAEQHYRKFSAWLAPLGVQIAWLHGGLPAAEKKAAKKAIAAGEREASPSARKPCSRKAWNSSRSRSPSSTSSTASA